MVEPLQWSSYFSFSREVLGKRRYILSEEAKGFLDRLLVIAGEKRTKVLSSGTWLWRARLGGEPAPVGDNDCAVAAFPIEQMGAPPKDKAKGGRIDCKGIPVLYVSSDRDTAMSEVRPWPGQKISLAQFALLREVKVVDFSMNCFRGTIDDLDRLWPLPHLLHKTPLTEAEHEEIMWCWIDKAFATPVSDTNDPVDYVPTQIIADVFKAADYDGMCYRSSVANGLNYAFFDVSCAQGEEPKIMYTLDVRYQFSSKQFRRINNSN